MTGDRKGKARAGDGRPTIGFVTLNLNQEQAADVWSGAVDAARERDANLVCLPGGGAQDVRSVLYDLVPAENLDGLVTFQWWASRQAFEEMYERYRPLPVVNVMRLYEGYPGVAWDNRQGTYDLVSHLIEVHGYRRIAYLGLFPGNEVAQERHQAYVDALAQHGIPLDPDLVMPVDYPGQSLSGTRGVSFLLDDRGLQPGKDLEAVVPYNDQQALQILDALRDRGVRVPQDVAVVGIDDLWQSAVSQPPLTTVAMPTREMGNRAVEMLLARLAGEEVPEHVLMPSPLIVRPSCGCMDAVALQARATVDACSEATAFAAVLAAQRDVVVREMEQAAGQDCDRLEDDWAEQLLDAFANSVGGDSPASVAPEEGFLSALSRFLELTSAAGRDVVSWQNVMSAMRRRLLLCFGDAGEMSRAESLWGQARVLVGEMMRRVQAREGLRTAQQAQQLQQVSMALAAATDVEQLADILAQELPQLAIPSCHLALYEDPTAPAERSRLVLAYDEQGRVDLEVGGRRLPSGQLVSGNTLEGRQHSIVVEPLYFQEEHLGFALFEVGPRDGNVYPVLASQISGTLRGVLLTREQARLREESDEARRQLEEALGDLQAAQRRYLRQAWERSGASAEGSKGFVVSREGRGATTDAWLSAMTHAVQQQQRVSVGEETGTELALPIVLGGQVIGVLGFSRDAEGDWDEAEIADAEAVIAQMAQALENQRLLDEELQARIALDEQVKALDCLNDIGRRMEEAPPISEFLQWVAERVPPAMRHPDVCLVAVEYGGEVYGSPEAPEEPRQIVQGMRLGGQLVGRVCIAYTEDYEFQDEESALLGDVARRVGGYIENRQLLYESQSRAERERLVRTITDDIRRGTESEAIVHIGLEQLRQWLGADRAIVRLGTRAQLGSVHSDRAPDEPDGEGGIEKA
jgi:DNA-binding LacI/PurR family transcriptional regulator/GAF domain-containing protein